MKALSGIRARFSLRSLLLAQLAVGLFIWSFQSFSGRVSAEHTYLTFDQRWPLPLSRVNAGLIYEGKLDPGIYIAFRNYCGKTVRWSLAICTERHRIPSEREHFVLIHTYPASDEMFIHESWSEAYYTIYGYPTGGGACLFFYRY